MNASLLLYEIMFELLQTIEGLTWDNPDDQCESYFCFDGYIVHGQSPHSCGCPEVIKVQFDSL